MFTMKNIFALRCPFQVFNAIVCAVMILVVNGISLRWIWRNWQKSTSDQSMHKACCAGDIDVKISGLVHSRTEKAAPPELAQPAMATLDITRNRPNAAKATCQVTSKFCFAPFFARLSRWGLRVDQPRFNGLPLDVDYSRLSLFTELHANLATRIRICGHQLPFEGQEAAFGVVYNPVNTANSQLARYLVKPFVLRHFGPSFKLSWFGHWRSPSMTVQICTRLCRVKRMFTNSRNIACGWLAPYQAILVPVTSAMERSFGPCP